MRISDWRSDVCSSDLELAMIYDSFTVTAGITAEMLRLTPLGEGPSLWADGKAGPGGAGIPVNTNGGGLSFSHSGMYGRSEEHTSELQSLMRISYAVFCLQKKIKKQTIKSKLQT